MALACLLLFLAHVQKSCVAGFGADMNDIHACGHLRQGKRDVNALSCVGRDLYLAHELPVQLVGGYRKYSCVGSL